MTRTDHVMEFELSEYRALGGVTYDFENVIPVQPFLLVKGMYVDERLQGHEVWMVVHQDIVQLSAVPKGPGHVVLKRGSNERYFMTQDMAMLCAKSVASLGVEISTLSTAYFGKTYNDLLDYCEDRQALGNLAEDEIFLRRLGPDNKVFTGVAEIILGSKVHLVYVVGFLDQAWKKGYPPHVVNLRNIRQVDYYTDSSMVDKVYEDHKRGGLTFSTIKGSTRETIIGLLSQNKGVRYEP